MASADFYTDSTKRNRSQTADTSRSPKRTKEGSLHNSGSELGTNGSPPQHSTPPHGFPPGVQQFMSPHVAPHHPGVPSQFLHVPHAHQTFTMPNTSPNNVIEATSKAGIDISRNDIETSHRIVKPSNRTAPSQIIVRLKSVDKIFQLLKSSIKLPEQSK